MELRSVSAILFWEDDSYVAVFAFVLLREGRVRIAQTCVPSWQSPGDTLCISLSRGAHGAVA